MLSLAMFGWWYTTGWYKIVNQAFRRLGGIYGSFSVGVLIRSLFAPWKQIAVVSTQNTAIGFKLRAVLDNVVSRFVGLVVRLLTLLTAGALLLIVAIFSLVVIVIWPIMPVLPVFLLLKGFGL